MFRRTTKIYLVVFLFVHILSLPSFAFAEASFNWSISEDGTLTITGEGPIPHSYSPWSQDVSADNIVSVVYGEGITEIGDFTTYGFSNVQSITFPSTLRSIGGQNFRCPQLKELRLPEGLVEIDYCSFQYCDSLTSIIIPSTVTTIGFGAFTRCKSLQNIYVAAGNQYYESREGVLYRTSYNYVSLVCYPIGRNDTTYVVEKDAKSIGDYVFTGSQTLEEVILPEGLTSISESFEGCSPLCRLTLPETLKSIGYYAFSGCTLLESVRIPDSVTSMGEYIFPKSTIILCAKGSVADEYAKRNGHLILYTEEILNVVLPTALTTIDTEAFYDCSFEAIYISEDVIFIGNNAFSKNTIIICPRDSYANTWARSNGYKVVNEQS